MENIELQAKKDEFGRWFFYSVLAVFLINTIIHASSDYFGQKLYAVPIWFFIAFTLLIAYTGFLLHKVNYNFKLVFTVIMYIFMALFTYLSLLLCNISETVFLYYLPIVAFYLMLNSFRKTFIFACIILVVCFFMPEISQKLGIGLDQALYQSNKPALKFQEYLVVVISVFYTLLILYYTMKFLEIRNKYQTIANAKTYPENNLQSQNFLNKRPLKELENQDEKLKHLYHKIIIFFNEQKPYQDANFNIKILADQLDSNTSYVSAALNNVGNKKFNQLVNEYRIEQVKISLQENVHSKFTIEHIYTSVGFSSQSTFNRIFKEQMGVTPTEHIDSLVNNR